MYSQYLEQKTENTPKIHRKTIMSGSIKVKVTPECYYQEFRCTCVECKKHDECSDLSWWRFYVCNCRFKGALGTCPVCGDTSAVCASCINPKEKPRGTPVPKGAVMNMADIFGHTCSHIVQS